jgi:hypothetical protein
MPQDESKEKKVTLSSGKEFAYTPSEEMQNWMQRIGVELLPYFLDHYSEKWPLGIGSNGKDCISVGLNVVSKELHLSPEDSMTVLKDALKRENQDFNNFVLDNSGYPEKDHQEARRKLDHYPALIDKVCDYYVRETEREKHMGTINGKRNPELMPEGVIFVAHANADRFRQENGKNYVLSGRKYILLAGEKLDGVWVELPKGITVKPATADGVVEVDVSKSLEHLPALGALKSLLGDAVQRDKAEVMSGLAEIATTDKKRRLCETWADHFICKTPVTPIVSEEDRQYLQTTPSDSLPAKSPAARGARNPQ